MQRVVEDGQGGPPLADDPAGLLEQRVTQMQARDAGECPAWALSVLERPVAATVSAASFVAQAVLALSLIHI